MTKLSYSEQMKHPNWQRRRLEVMSNAGFACESCGDTETTLNVHHVRYVKGRMAWDYPDHELRCLCWPCHEQQHERRELLDRLLTSTEAHLCMAIGLLAGYLEGGMALEADIESESRAVGGPYFVAGQIGQLLERHNWSAVGRSLRAFVESKGVLLNPSEQLLIEFLCDQPAATKDL